MQTRLGLQYKNKKEEIIYDSGGEEILAALPFYKTEGDVPMTQCKTAQPSSQFHVVIIDGATYEVTSNYNGDMTFLDLLKQMLKRDMERQEK